MSTPEQDKHQVFETQKEIREMKAVQAEQRELIRDIHTAIMGSSLTRDGGMVERLKEVERKQVEQDERLQKIEQQRVEEDNVRKSEEDRRKRRDRVLRRVWAIAVAAAGIAGFIINHFFNTN